MARAAASRRRKRNSLNRRRRKIRSQRRGSTGVVVEALEPRILLSADVSPAAGQALIDGLDTLDSWVDQIEAIGDLADDLPLVGDSLGDLLGLGATLRSSLLDLLRNELPGDLADPTALSDDIANAMNLLPGISVTDESTPTQIRFDVDFDLSEARAVPLSLGDAAAAAGIGLEAELDLDTEIHFDFDFGFDLDGGLSPEEAFFLEVETFTVSVAVGGFLDGGISTPTLDTDFDLGFVDAHIVGGSLDFVAALDLDPDSDGDGVTTLQELLSSALSPDSIGIAPSTQFSATLPVEVDFGAPGVVDDSFDFPTSEGVTLAIQGLDAGNLFDLPDFDIAVDVPDLNTIGFDPADFTNLSAGELVSLLNSLANQLQVLTGILEPVVDDVPGASLVSGFVSDATSAALDVFGMVRDLAGPLFDPGVNAVSPPVLDLTGQTVTFEVSVNGAAPAMVTVPGASYASASALAGAVTTALGTAGLDLEAVLQNGQLQLRAVANDIVEFSLSDVSPQAVTGLGLEDEMLSVPFFNFATIQDFEDLLNDPANGLLGSLLGSAIDAAYDATSNTIGFTLELARSFSDQVPLALSESVDLGIATLELLAGGSVGVSADAALMLGVGLDLQGLLGTTPLDSLNGGRGVRTSGPGDADLNFEVREPDPNPNDGVPGTLVAAWSVDLSDASTIQDVIDTVVQAAQDAGQTVGMRLDPGTGLVLEAPDGLVLNVGLVAGSTAAFDLGFGILSASNELGEIGGASLLERLFVEAGSSLEASATFDTPDPLTGFASVGFLDATVSASLSGPIGLTLTASLVDPDGDMRVSLLELSNPGEGSPHDLSFTLSGGTLAVGLELGSDTVDLPEISASFTATFMQAAANDPIQVDFDTSGVDLDAILEQFGSLTLDDLLSLALQVAQTLTGDSSFLGQDLPLLGTSISDLLSLVGDGIDGAIAALGEDFSDLRTLLNPALAPGNAGATEGGVLDLPLFRAFLSDATFAEDSILAALEAIEQLGDPANGIRPDLDGLNDDLLLAVTGLDEAIRALPTDFSLSDNPAQLYVAFQALLATVERVRSVKETDLDALAALPAGADDFSGAELRSAFEGARSDLVEGVFGVDGGVEGLRNLIPTGDRLLELLFDTLGFSLPDPSDAVLGPLETLLDQAIGALDGVRDALTPLVGSLPSGTPAAVGTALDAALAAIDTAQGVDDGTNDDGDGVLERALQSIQDLRGLKALNPDMLGNSAELLRAYRAVVDGVGALGSAASELADAIQAIDDLAMPEAAVEDLRDDVLIPQRDALVADVQARIADALDQVLHEFSGRVLTLSFDPDGGILLNFHYDADVISDVLGLANEFQFDFSLEDDLGVEIPFDVSAMISGMLGLTGAFDIGFGVDLSDPLSPDFFLVADSGIELMAGDGQDPAGPAVIEGEVEVSLFSFPLGSLGGPGTPATITLGNAAMDGPALLKVTIDDTGATDGRVLLGTDPIEFTSEFDAQLDYDLPVFILGSQVMVDDGGMLVPLSIAPVSPVDLDDFSFPTPSLPDGGADAILQAILDAGLDLTRILDAFDALLGLLQDGLGSDALSNLPVVGDAASGGADAIGDVRAFVDNLRTQAEALYDELVALADPTAIEQRIEEFFADGMAALGTAVDLTVDDLSQPLVVDVGFGQLSLDIQLMTGAVTAGDPTLVLSDPDLELLIDVAWTIDEMRVFDFDWGLDAFILEVSTDGGVELDINASVAATLGLGLEGAFLELSDDISASIEVGLTEDTTIAARLFFFDLVATPYDEDDDIARMTALEGGDAIAGAARAAANGVQEGVRLGGGLTLPTAGLELLAVDFDDFSVSSAFTADPGDAGGPFDPDLAFGLDIDLLLEASIGMNPDLPSLQVALDVDWDAFSLSGGVQPATASFNDLTLDLGKFLGNALSEVVENVVKFTKPLEPILALLGTEIPVISDLSKLLGQDPITFGDAIGLLGSGFDTIQPFLDVLETIEIITDIADALVATPGEDSLVIDFGSLDLTAIGADLTDPGDTSMLQGGSFLESGLGFSDFGLGGLPDFAGGADSGDENVNQAFANTSSGSFSDIGFPLFTNAGNLFGLLFGQRSDIITWDLPKLAAEFGFSYSFGPILPPIPLFATIAGSFEIFADFALGFDTRAFEGENFFYGFHFEDLAIPDDISTFDHTGEDILELGLSATFSATAKLSVVVASAGVTGGITAQIGANWHDNDGDGRIYLDELLFNFSRGFECIFDFEGALEAFLEAFVKIGFDTPFGFVTLFEQTLELARVTLADFSVTCPPLPPPVPGTLIGDDVYLNIGPRAEFRQPGAQDIDESVFVIAERHFLDDDGNPTDEIAPLVDINENGKFEEAEFLAANDYDGDGIINVNTILVSGFGEISIFSDVQGRIIGDGGMGEDEIIFDPSVVRPSVLAGGPGDDKIQGGSGMDEIHGDAGAVSGDAGDDELLGGAAMDTIFGGAGNDSIKGQEGDDKLFGEAGDDVIAGNQGSNTNEGPGFQDDDIIDGGAGADDINADFGDDLVAGNSGSDDIDGGLGDDTLWGDAAIDPGTLQVRNFALSGDPDPDEGQVDLVKGGDGSDEIHGGGGNDILFGEDARAAVGGDDVIFGDGGNDTIRDGFLGDQGEEGLEAGNDEFHGGDGDDSIETQSGFDMAFGGAGNDLIFTGTEADYVEGNAGRDFIRSGSGDDRVIGGSRPGAGAAIDVTAEFLFDEALGGDFEGLDDADDIDTGEGNDLVIGDNGAFYTGTSLTNAGTSLTTDPLDDVILITTFSRGGNGADLILGGEGDDRIFAGGGADQVFGDAFGGSGHDIVVGDQGYMHAALIVAASSSEASAKGDDNLQGLGGNDILIGGDGADVAGGSAGRDLLVGDNAEVDILGVAGQSVPVVPVVLEVRSRDTDQGGDDRLLGNQGSDIAIGGFGDDFISGGGNGDVPTPGDPFADILLGDHATVRTDPASDDHDVFSIDDTPAHNGADRIVGSGRDDIIIGGGNDDSLSGLNGLDVMLGDHGYVDRDGSDDVLQIRTTSTAIGGRDEAFGDAGNDIILGGADGDVLHGNDGDDTVLGDNGRLDWLDLVLDPGQDKATLDLITTTAPTDGGADLIFGDADEDILLGGTDKDEVHGGDDDDLMFGDHGKREVQGPANANFFAIDTGAADGGNDDQLFGEAGNDILLGQQGDDVLFGGSEDDDLIGGHNVAGGIDEIDLVDDFRNDVMDGGPGFDLLAGDNADVIRQALPDGTLTGSFSPRFRALNGEIMYAADGSADVDPDSQEDPKAPRPVGRDVTLLDHDDATEMLAGARPFGADHMVGGEDDDSLFGELDADIMLGDGAVDDSPLVTGDGIVEDVTLNLLLFEAATDGDDYMEGGGGNDMMWGGLGQDDMIGGSSDLFGLVDPDDRPDGSDVMFGGAGGRIGRNEFVDVLDPLIAPGDRHARDSDFIMGDNARIFRLVEGGDPPTMLTFGYDTSDPDRTSQIVPRAFDLLDYDPADVAASRGAGETLYGESGDDFVHGMTGNDVLFGGSENDDLFGENGSDWATGDTGDDALLGDDGKIFTSRGGVAEPLYGIEATVEEFISTPANALQATLDPAGGLKRTVDLEPFEVGYDDVLYGGLGDDAAHGGAGNDGVSGAEAMPLFYAAHATGSVVEIAADGRIVPRDDGGIVVPDFYSLTNALPRIDGHPLNFLTVEVGGDPVKGDGEDVLFGDLGNDWIVGGTGRDRMYGGLGFDILNADDDLDTNGGLNDVPDAGVLTPSENADIAFGGGGRDLLIGNTGADRLIDWTGEFNEYQLPFAPFGNASAMRNLAPWLSDFLYAVSASDGADPTRVGGGLGTAARNGEPFGELGLVRPQDPQWRDQHGGPYGGQAGNSPGGQRDTHGDDFGGGGNGEAFEDGGLGDTGLLLQGLSLELLGAAPGFGRPGVEAPDGPTIHPAGLAPERLEPGAASGVALFEGMQAAFGPTGKSQHSGPAAVEEIVFDPRSAIVWTLAESAGSAFDVAVIPPAAPAAGAPADPAAALAAGAPALESAEAAGEGLGVVEAALGGLALVAAIGAEEKRRRTEGPSWAAGIIDWGAGPS